MMHLCYSAQLCPALSCRTWLSVARPTTSVRTSTVAGTSSALTPASWTTLAPERPSARSLGTSPSASARLGSRETRGSNADRRVRQTRKLTENQKKIVSDFYNTFYIPILFNKYGIRCITNNGLTNIFSPVPYKVSLCTLLPSCTVSFGCGTIM